ncbi:cation transporter [Rhodobacteraceae bacterium WD3A24]|nr:cation transporter [Rhodobacteraceae bacterium WD3A24]
MPHDHPHHHHVAPEAGDRRVALAVLVNVALTAAQVVGGILAGSLSLIADALHNFSDALSLVIAFVARRIARRPADAVMTFGYARAETVAALINYTTLIVIGLYLLYEAALRFADPAPIDGWIVVVIAAVALVVDLVTAGLTYALSKHSMNIRAAFLHNLADALGSVGVMIAGGGAILYDLHILDPVITVGIAAYILWHAGTEIGGVIRVLMLGAPPDIQTRRILETMEDAPGVAGVHHLHLWQMEEDTAALEAHVTVEEGRWHEADAIKQALRKRLKACGVGHATLELECHRHACDGAAAIGHD